jgi:hypothetical protein
MGIHGKVSTGYCYKSILCVVERIRRDLGADPKVQRSIAAESRRRCSGGMADPWQNKYAIWL